MESRIYLIGFNFSDDNLGSCSGINQRPQRFQIRAMTFLFLFVFVTTRFAVSGSRTPDPLVEFQLLRNDCIGASSMFPDSSPSNYLGGVQRDVDRTECIRGNGVSAKANAAQGKAALASTYAIGGLMPHLRGSELSIEFWVRSSDSIVCETVLLGFAARDEMSPYSFHLTQRPVNDPHQAGHMRMLARNKAGSVLSLESSLLHQGEYSHVVIDLRYLSPIFAGKKFSMISENTTVNATTGMVIKIRLL